LGHYGATDVTCPIAEFCTVKRLSTAEQDASLVTRYQVHLNTMHYTLLSLYMMCTGYGFCSTYMALIIPAKSFV